MLTPSQLKRAAHKERFRKGAEELEHLLTPNQIAWRDYLGDHVFEFRPRPIGNDPDSDPLSKIGGQLTSKIGNGATRGTRGPCTKSTQYTRAVRRK